MLIYKRNLKVTQDDFTNKQEEIKNAIRQLVDGYLKNFNEQNFPSTKVDFAIPMSDELKTKYHFLFTQTAPIEKTFAELWVTIEIVSEEELNKKEENHYTYY